MRTEWSVVGACVQGSLHLDADIPCQDAFSVSSIGTAGAYLAFVCCDGAGGAELGGLGASMTVETVAQELAQRAGRAEKSPMATTDWLETLDAVRRRLASEALLRGRDLSDLATTLIAGVVGPDVSSFAQIGDGAVVVDTCAEQYTVVTWPQHGPYHNVTNFVTSEGATGLLACATASNVRAFAVFTDGLERLVLDFIRGSATNGFLDPMWGELRRRAKDPTLRDDLAAFLDSARVRARTDDDLTLILAARQVDGAW